MTQQPIFPQVLTDRPITYGSAPAIAERITSSISLGMLAVGERLPNEQELAAQFGVAVATLRKTLAILRDRGLVETRRGRSGGTFVVRAPFPEPAAVEAYFAEHSVAELRDLGDEHTAVSVAIVKLACKRSHAVSVDRVMDLASRIGDAETPAERASADSRFHIELAVVAQSPRLLRSELRLQSEVSPLLWSELVGDVQPETAIADHLAIAAAIAKDDLNQAEELVEDHIRQNIYRLIDAKLNLGTKPGDGWDRS